MSLPNNLLYGEQVWVKKEGDDATVGVADYALATVKEIVFIELPKKGRQLTKGGEFISLESVKWSGHIKSPLSGKVTEVNEGLFDEPERLNKDPYGSWICKIELSYPDELDELMDASKAQRWVQENLG
jgi:glycine cleavage system H protein